MTLAFFAASSRLRPLLRRVGITLAALAFVSAISASSSAEAGEPFTVKVEPPAAAKVGGAATARVVVKAAAGYHLNKEFPTSLKLTAPVGVDLASAKLTVKDGGVKLSEGEAAADVAFTSREAGAKSFTGTFSFAVCTDNTCVPSKAAVSFVVDVK